MKTRNCLMGMIVVLVSLVGVSSVQAGPHERIEKLICSLQTNAQNLNTEIVSQYRMVPQFPCLSNEAGQILSLSSQVRELVHCGNIGQLNQNLCQIERLARHVQDELDNVDDLPRHSHFGRACRVDTRRAYRLAEDIEDDAIDLKADARHLPAPHVSSYRSIPQNHFYNSQPNGYGYGPEAIPPGYGAPAYYGSGYRSSTYVPGPRPNTGRPAIEFGSGGIRITFGN